MWLSGLATSSCVAPAMWLSRAWILPLFYKARRGQKCPSFVHVAPCHQLSRAWLCFFFAPLGPCTDKMNMGTDSL